jgi:hypothetical protein
MSAPKGVVVSQENDRDAGRLGGRISCATISGASTGQVCIAVDSVVMVTVIDLTPAVDQDLPRRAREAVVHRS